MARYLQTQVLFERNGQRKWLEAVIDLDSVSTANPAWVFDDYDEDSPGYPEPNTTEIYLRDGSDISVNMPYKIFLQHLIGM